jgi:hypothetical protein
VQPVPAYRHIYPFADGELDDLAYFFSYGYQDGRDVLSYAGPLVKKIVDWQDAYDSCRLLMIDRGDHLLISDTRPWSGGVVNVVEGLARELYLACDDITTVDRLCRTAAAPHGAELSRHAVEEALEPLLEQGLLLRQGDALLALANPGSLTAAGA